jgi:filamentous hemagglutinin family protein
MKLVWRSLFFCSLSLAVLVSLVPLASVKAQIEPDNTLGTQNSQVTPDNINGVDSDRIDGGATRDSNLFHSFREFNVGENRGAYFTNPDDITNIFSRVTGGNSSNILGRLGVLGNANLFFINPNGIFFGPNASLDLGGSFFASTADSVVFDNNFEFSASNPTAPLLTVNIPTGLRFRDNPGGITTNRSVASNGSVLSSFLQVQPGRTLALVGGNVSLDGGILSAPGGRIELGGLSAAGTVGINDGSLSFPDGVARSDVSLTNGAAINVQAGGGGSIAVNARNLDILSRSRLLAGIAPNQGTSDSQAGSIILDATDRVEIAGTPNSPSSIINATGDFSNLVAPSALGQAGDIVISTKIFEGSGSFLIGSLTNGSGDAGRVFIQADDRVSLTGNFGSAIFSIVGPSGTGNGGDIAIDTRSLNLSNAGLVASTVGTGNAGNIGVIATESITLDSGSQMQAVVRSGAADAGNIEIAAPEGSIFLDRATISSTNAGTGFAGDININARDQIRVINSSISATGRFGRISIGKVDSTQSPLPIPSSVEIDNSTLNVTNSDTNLAGDIDINARDQIRILSSTLSAK